VSIDAEGFALTERSLPTGAQDAILTHKESAQFAAIARIETWRLKATGPYFLFRVNELSYSF
jgi:hypothetical protein